MRLDIDLIAAIKAKGTQVVTSLRQLDTLVDFRNAAVHGNETAVERLLRIGEIRPTLASYRRYRRSLNRLIDTMDVTVAEHLSTHLSIPIPW